MNELGHFSLILAFLLACIQASVPLIGVARQDNMLMHIASRAAFLQFFFCFFAFCVLMTAFIRSDFSVINVAVNSHIAKPMLYKITAVWGNHEGSMLLWVLIVALYGAAFAYFSAHIPLIFRARILAIQGGIGALFGAFILFTSNPFLRLSPAPFSGQGLNPILQDPALAAHPPLLYAGYVGFSLTFSFALAALLARTPSPLWARWMRLWVRLAWIFLTLGIALGSYWAYYELGWGGFWFWDPVENASLMPWLSGTALLHSTLVVAQRGALQRWTLLLAIITFGLSLMGTFLVRSGVLTSVHAFANDPERGVFILMIMAITIGGALLLYARAASYFVSKTLFHPLSRETALLVNNVFLATATATVFIGTLYPLVLDAFGLGKISVGAPYFATLFTPLCVPFIMLIPFGPFLSWRQAELAVALRRVRFGFAAVVIVILGLYAGQAASLAVSLAIGGAFWVIMGGMTDIYTHIKTRMWHIRPYFFASGLAHAGIGIMLLGIIGATAWRAEVITAVRAGDIVQIAQFSVRYAGADIIYKDNYRATRARVDYVSGPANFGTLWPERRFYTVERTQTTEAAIYKGWAGHLYVVIGEAVEDDKRILRIWYHPLIVFIWLGAGFMALGGLCSVSRHIKWPVRSRKDG